VIASPVAHATVTSHDASHTPNGMHAMDVNRTASLASPMLPHESSESVIWRDKLADTLSGAIRSKENAPGERLTREFEETLIRTALAETKGRRIEASLWLGWGRNTLTRKIHELGLDDQV
jgi:DNA-binding NtrC family response regulator